MATTEPRTGFRLPWSADRSSSREAGALEDEVANEGGGLDVPDAAGQVQTPGGAPTAPVTGPESPEPSSTGVAGSEPAPEAGPAVLPARAPAPARRPSKFLADLMKAMHAAAEAARTASLEQFRTDGKAFVEQIHARSAGQADELRRRTDEDIAAIKDWSKAEIARVREETELRVTTRRQRLEDQVERHAALIEREIEKVQVRVAGYESEMKALFDDLLAEEDPAAFAARAAQLPEPPSFEEIDEEALVELLAEPAPSVTVDAAAKPEAAVQSATQTEPASPPEPEAAVGPDIQGEPASPPEPEAAVGPLAADLVADEDAGPAVPIVADEIQATQGLEPAPEPASPPEPEAAAELVGAPEPEAAAEPTVDVPLAAAEPLDREAAMAAIQAAAEAAAAHEAAEAEVSVGVEETPPTAGRADEGELRSVAEHPDEPEVDPRIAMLGLTPDYAAAEAEAAAAASAAAGEGFEEMGEDSVSARLAGLIPTDVGTAPALPPIATVTSQVVVVGLVSVASIASFKRHLGRLTGVQHVGVSSGPDGEFVFTVTHQPDVALRELVPTIPGFQARVSGTGEGIVNVTAQDPED